MATEAVRRAVAKYTKEKTFEMKLRFPKRLNPGQNIVERWRMAAEMNGQSLTMFVYETMEARVRTEFPKLKCPER